MHKAIGGWGWIRAKCLLDIGAAGARICAVYYETKMCRDVRRAVLVVYYNIDTYASACLMTIVWEVTTWVAEPLLAIN